MPAAISVPYPLAEQRVKYTGKEGPRSRLWSPVDPSLTWFEDSFNGDAIMDRYAASTSTTNGTGAAIAVANPGLTLTTGTSDDGRAGQTFSLDLSGDQGFLAEIVLTLPSDLTTFKFEAGVTDVVNEAGGAVNDKGAGTATATDFAVLVFDTDDDTNLAAISAKAGTVVATQDIMGLVASTTYIFSVRVDGDNVQFYVNGELVASHGNSAGIEGGTALTLSAFAQSRAVSQSRVVTLNKWHSIQRIHT